MCNLLTNCSLEVICHRFFWQFHSWSQVFNSYLQFICLYSNVCQNKKKRETCFKQPVSFVCFGQYNLREFCVSVSSKMVYLVFLSLFFLRSSPVVLEFWWVIAIFHSSEPAFSGSYADADYLWSPVFPSSQSMPCARNRHSVCVWGGGVFVYGGRGTRGTLKDFWRYDIGKTWYSAAATIWLLSKCAFHLPELAGQTGQSVNRMSHFEGTVLQNLEK